MVTRSTTVYGSTGEGGEKQEIICIQMQQKALHDSMLSVYKKRGTPLYPFTCARAVGAAPTVTPSRTGEVSQGRTEAQDNQRNAKAKTRKSTGTKQVPLARPLLGQPLAGAARPTPTERATLEPPVPNAIIRVGPGPGKAPPWWHADLCEDIFKIR